MYDGKHYYYSEYSVLPKIGSKVVPNINGGESATENFEETSSNSFTSSKRVDST